MLNNYPLKINGEEIPFPKTIETNDHKLANEFETEDGKRRQSIVRASRLTLSMTWVLSSAWLAKFIQYKQANSFVLSLYDPTTKSYKDREMSATPDGLRAELIEGSEKLRATDGLYKVSMDMEEF